MNIRGNRFVVWMVLLSLIARVEARTGYEVWDHLLQLFGLCPECQANQAA